MTRIFLLHATEDLVCSSRVRQDLEASGYDVDDEVQTLDVGAMLYPRSAKSALVASAVVVLLWSGNAARNPRIRAAVQFTEQLKRPIFPVSIDGTAVSFPLQAAMPVLAQAQCDAIVASLVPSLPAVRSNDALVSLYEQAVNIAVPPRIEAIERMATLLRSGQYASGQPRDALFALLECLAKDDPLTSVREKASEVLRVLRAGSNTSPPSPLKPQLFDRGSSYDYLCVKQHTTTFSKRELCDPNPQKVVRGTAKVTLSCKTCKERGTFDINC